MIYIGIGILLATSVAAGLLLWQGRSLQAEGTPAPCPSLNLPEENPVGVSLNHAPMCPGGDWKKRHLGNSLEKSAPIVALVGTILGFASLTVAFIPRKVQTQKKGR